jgi:NIPSNAP
MLYEMRTYTTPAGKAPLLADTSAEIARSIRGDEYGKLEGYWITDIGPLNKCMHLWSYHDLNHREERRAALSRNERWKSEYLPKAFSLVRRQDIRLMVPARPLNPPTTQDNIYEFHYYRCHVGKTAEFVKRLLEALPAREKLSRNVCVWTTIAGQPNEVCHLWAYEGLEQRAKVEAAARANKEWQEFLATALPLVDEMDSMLIRPWRQSPLK